jgi:hypothetical protein
MPEKKKDKYKNIKAVLSKVKLDKKTPKKKGPDPWVGKVAQETSPKKGLSMIESELKANPNKQSLISAWLKKKYVLGETNDPLYKKRQAMTKKFAEKKRGEMGLSQNKKTKG